MSEMGMAMMGTGVSAGENRAKEAAETAISSPLLEDIDINDARGVLVNITAGLDMSIGEFEAVGDVIKSFASENATVVVGTVIDPDMTDELRVTVVVTGLGKGGTTTAESRSAATATKTTPAPAEAVRLIDPSLIRADGTVDYQALENPTMGRRQSTTPKIAATELGPKDVDYLEIPAFLRRQSQEE
jgi:cell division protein FtsZ